MWIVCWTESQSRVDLSAAQLVSLMFVYVYCIQLKMCVGYTELGNRVRPTARGCHEDIPAAHGGDKKRVGCFSSSETWDLLDRYSCLRLHLLSY